MHSQGIQAKVAPSWTMLCGDSVNKTQSLKVNLTKGQSFFFFPPGTEDKTTIQPKLYYVVFSCACCFFILYPGCLYCAVSFCAPSLYLYNWNSYSGFISSCLELPRRTLTFHLYLFKRLPLRLIFSLVNLSTLSLFTFLHWLAFLPPICYNSSCGRRPF